MRKIVLIAFCLLMLLPSAAFAELKIGVINFEGIVTQSEYGKRARDKMEARVKSIEASLSQAQQEIEKFQQELSKQSMALSQEAQKDKIAQYREKVIAFEKKRQESQQEIQKAEREIFQPVIELLVKVSQDYARKNGYHLMLNAKSSVIYAGDGLDLTMPILEAFNAASKGK